jgi:hypothetical protein
MKVTRCSYDGEGNLIHEVFAGVACFSGIHILHAVISFVMLLVFLAICYVVASCFYESRIG